MDDDYVAGTVTASKELKAAQARHAALAAKADGKLAEAQARHRVEMAAARQHEAQGWAQLMAVPGMTVSTAARIGKISAIKVSRWLAEANSQDPSCT